MTLWIRLSDAGLTINLKKCAFGCATVTYLGREVGQSSTKPRAAKVEAILDFPPPSTRRSLMRFLGMAGFYRCFCPNFSCCGSFDWNVEPQGKLSVDNGMPTSI